MSKGHPAFFPVLLPLPGIVEVDAVGDTTMNCNLNEPCFVDDRTGGIDLSEFTPNSGGPIVSIELISPTVLQITTTGHADVIAGPNVIRAVRSTTTGLPMEFGGNVGP